MRTYDLDNLSRDLDAWLKQRLLQPILDIEGGWEYWMQIDFPAWLDQSSGSVYDFRREMSLRLSDGKYKRVDWIINGMTTSNPIAVEIKAQTHKYRNSAFLADVRDDVEKLQNLIDPCAVLSLAAVIDAAAYEQLINRAGFRELVRLGNDLAVLGWFQPAPDTVRDLGTASTWSSTGAVTADTDQT